VQGRISFRPARWSGAQISGATLWFERGKVTEVSARRGVSALAEALQTDNGARRVGEFGMGINYALVEPTGHELLDEKIGGTVHLGLGASYAESGGTNRSALHWDLVCDLRHGGSITVDGIEIQRDGRFLREIGSFDE
jgi:aminopeptidase